MSFFFKEEKALNQQCSDKALVEIAMNLVNADQLWPFLDISEAEHEEIHRDNQGNYRNYKHRLLLAWRNHHIYSGQATYHNLCTIFKKSGHSYIINCVTSQASNG